MLQLHLVGTAFTLLLWTCAVAEDGCEVERIEESEVAALQTQLLQQKLQLGTAETRAVDEVPPEERFSLPLAHAFGSLSQAAFCGADETLRNWTCEACHAVGFGLSPGTTRLVRQAELGEADSTFIFASRLRYVASSGGHRWPSARAAEPVKHAKEECWGHCGSRGGFCDWCGVGNACCRQDEAGDPAECFNSTGFSGAEHHECVRVESPAPKIPVQHENEDCWIYCGKAGGFCDWCGGGNACCKQGYEEDPVECRGTKNSTPAHHVCTAVTPNVPPATAEDFGCVVSIRGSKTFTNALHDAFFWSDELPHEDCEGCQVFDGFWRVWSGIESKVERVLIDNGCIPGTPQGTILITGHSLGAAVATLAMYMLQLRGYSVGLSYNFESPRIGNDAFHDAFAKLFQRRVSVYRVTRARDPVVHVPPLPIYHHVGSEAYFTGDSPDDVVVCIGSEDPKCADRYSLFETIIFGAHHCHSELAIEKIIGLGFCQCVV